MATWIIIAAIIWVVVSVVVSLVLGGVVRLADSRGAVTFGRQRVRRLEPRPVPVTDVGPEPRLVPVTDVADVAEPLRQVS